MSGEGEGREMEHEEAEETDVVTASGAQVHHAESESTEVEWPPEQDQPAEEPSHDAVEEGSDPES
jgi:hypothetical protein